MVSFGEKGKTDELIKRQFAGIIFYHAGAFWLGTLAVTFGVLAHFPMYLMGKDQGYRLVGMPMDTPMMIGMAAIVAGLGACLYGLYPQDATKTAQLASQINVKALDDVKLNRAHAGLLLTMAVAITIDIMKPTALAFVMPGMALEYDLKSPLNPSGGLPAAYLPLVAITGTVVGSFVWGWLGDKIGRRASILYAGIGFIATSICGAMPDFYWNLIMCFLMGMAVGGMLPICYALLAETIPARHRGWLMILVGADVAGAYILTSWIASALVPIYSWRILWLIGLPTGLLFILLNRWIPESPRFLIATGREKEAREVMARFGATVVEQSQFDLAAQSSVESRWTALFSPAFIRSTLVVGCLAFGSGLILFGFNLWIPTNLRKLGLPDADTVLRNAALMGFPMTFAVAWLYGFWSSRKTIILLSSLTAIALFGFAIFGDAVAQNRVLLYVLITIPICAISSIVATASVYSSEIYPTQIRSRGTGFAAGSSKFGGVAIIAAVAFGLTTPSVTAVALIGAISMTLAALLMARYGIETTKRQLEDIVVHELQHGQV